jgi:hypothetical protein
LLLHLLKKHSGLLDGGPKQPSIRKSSRLLDFNRLKPVTRHRQNDIELQAPDPHGFHKELMIDLV